jgi:acetyl-CoA carboxylase biotin carboxyl carrier protein
MKGKDLKELGSFFKENNLVELSIEYEGNKIHIKKDTGFQENIVPVKKAIQAQTRIKKPTIKEFKPEQTDVVDDEKIKIIKTPISGTYYSSPSPTQPVFVKKGDHVNPDTVLCIIEAMKIMNEIKAECSGVVKEILVKNEATLQNDAAIMKIELD